VTWRTNRNLCHIVSVRCE